MPGAWCSVPRCTNTGGHVFPKDESLKKLWIIAIKRATCEKSGSGLWTPKKHSRVCHSHFDENDYIKETYVGTSPLVKRLKKTAVPHIFQWKTHQVNKERTKRQERRSLKKLVTPNIENVGLEVEISNSVDSPEKENSDLYEVTDNVEISHEEITTQTPKWPMFSVDKFRHDDELIHFYTGLENYDMFMMALNSLGPAVNELNYYYDSTPRMCVEDQFLLTLIKLRQHKKHFELAKLFGVSESVVTNIFVTWVNFMSCQWREVDIWPEKDVVRFFMPEDFKQSFPTTRVIMDGTEVKILKPGNPKDQQATFSTYKHSNTAKVLIGSTPGGLVSHVSDSYAGSASDRQIVERSNLRSVCDPGDSIMADKGFTVQDLFAGVDVQINVPTFFRKKNRLSQETVMKDRKIARKRVHIERIIGLGKTYEILKGPLTQTEALLASEIIFICFMLCNFRSCIM